MLDGLFSGLISNVLFNLLPWNSLLVNKYGYINSPRKKAIEGFWYGKTNQSIGVNGENMETKLNANFFLKGSLIKGKALISWEDEQITAKCIGGFLSESMVKLTYRSDDESLMNYGVALLNLNGAGNELEGNILGHGHLINSMFLGKANFKKKNTVQNSL